MTDLFESDPKNGGGARRAPADLNPAEWRALRAWAETFVPWVSRGGLGSLRSLEEYVDTCLAHFRAKKTMRPGWLSTVQNWVRRDERARIEKMAARGDENARLACRDPKAWAAAFDRKARLTAAASESHEIIVPSRPIVNNVDSIGARPSL